MNFKKKLKLSDIGEKQFLKEIFAYIDTPSVLEVNDDASAFSISENKVLLINADMLVSETDILPGTSLKQIGKKAVTMSVSDIIAKGTFPLACLASVCFPPSLDVTDANEILIGIKEMATEYNSLFLGGDLNQSNDIIIDIISFGITQPNNVIPRKGVEPGDVLFTTGTFGWTALGFKILLENMCVEEEYKIKSLKSVYEPRAKLEYVKLFESLPIKASIDSSDGLYSSIYELLSINNLGFSLTHLPVDKNFVSYCEKNGLNPLELTMNGGEEFEILFAVDKKDKDNLIKEAKKMNLSLIEVGYFTSNPLELNIEDKLGEIYSFSKKGFIHFKKS
ncbi:MAG: thiamine-phosphate kinase [Candidatus Heimdallarchaeaceae archaeon]